MLAIPAPFSCTSSQDLINFGILRVTGASTLAASGNVANFGLLDSMSWSSGGVGEFSDFSEFGSVMDSSLFRIQGLWMDEQGFHLQVPGSRRLRGMEPVGTERQQRSGV